MYKVSLGSFEKARYFCLPILGWLAVEGCYFMWWKSDSLVSASVPCISEYLMYLKTKGLYLKVQLAAISAYYLRSLFVHNMVKKLRRDYLKCIPLWGILSLLGILIWFYLHSVPLAEWFLYHLSLKMAFIISIMSARRVSELNALMADLPFMSFHKDKVFLRRDPRFLLKVVFWISHQSDNYCAAISSKTAYK